jgi:TATA-box binding protein (TBP) (component of TFIID and TFIIIB)
MLETVKTEYSPKVKNYKISFRTGISKIERIIRKNKTLQDCCKFFHNFVVIRKRYVYTLFFSGFCNVTKIRKRRSCKKAKRYFYEKVLRFDKDDAGIKYKIDNITASGKLGYTLNLDRLRSHFLGRGNVVGYNPDQFAGASIRLELATIVLFHSGAYTIVGAHRKRDVEKTFSIALKEIECCKI